MHVTVTFDGTGVDWLLVHSASPLVAGSQGSSRTLLLEIDLLAPTDRLDHSSPSSNDSRFLHWRLYPDFAPSLLASDVTNATVLLTALPLTRQIVPLSKSHRTGEEVGDICPLNQVAAAASVRGA